jgi:hypothetical protein
MRLVIDQVQAQLRWTDWFDLRASLKRVKDFDLKNGTN